MQDELKALNRQVLATFGQSVLILRSDDSELETTGVLSRELIPTGQYEQVLQEVTVLALASETPLKRGERVSSDGQQWTVDRKLKSDGHMIWWNLHEAGS
ncbi:hypothetical protein [Endozoicomonas numazuensis]|uniref:Uncharacterized protein n=1 Tax=Endozoicomonas numazuensis TaxID=1137799 RepID=A0A081NFB2_9GAMM|nr:hypothetical protein [Endozoicomonas numazuensis]KEQ17135.1 hypothetical protein GZ78_14795 [Endozoicomonas numazuensis]